MFHVVEWARHLSGPLGSDVSYGNNGAFQMSSPIPGRWLLIIASDGYGWEHVSVHVEDRKGRLHIPIWDEMCFVKERFWDAEDIVMQLHPARSQWVNTHPYTLHLWRPLSATIPTPPPLLVGIPTSHTPARNA